MNLKLILATLITIGLGMCAFAVPRVTYTKISDEAVKTGQTKYYNDVKKTVGSINLDGYILNYKVPSKARAYDSIPIEYTLTRKSNREVAIEANAFEEVERKKGKELFDLNIPGGLSVEIEYLGNITADYDTSNYPFLTPNPKEAAPLDYIPIKRYDFLESNEVKAGDCVWFQFKVTNTGDTILDPEGFSSSFGYSEIMQVDENGNDLWERPSQTINIYQRSMNYIYPGESWTLWVQFNTDRYFGWPGRQLQEGNYRVMFSMLYKYNREYNHELNVWHGREFARITVPITVTKTGGITPIEYSWQNTDIETAKMPLYFDKFEEFMSSFDFYAKEDKRTKINEKMHLQIAPWTKHVTLKLVLTEPNAIKTVDIPISVSLDNLDIKYNAQNPMVIENEQGEEEPTITIMAMPGMRTNFQLGPYPEVHMDAELAEIKSLGANLIANTSGNWWIDEASGYHEEEDILEPLKVGYRYWYDYLMRKYNMKCIGWSIYPPSHPSYFKAAKKAFNIADSYSENPSTYQNLPGIDLGDPIVPKLLGIWSKYIYERWGDLWYKDKTGKIEIDTEDTWGWMRYDVNDRMTLGTLGVKKFRAWVMDKYRSDISLVNKAWNSSFNSFEEIDPDAVNSFVEKKNNQEFYNASDPVFHDWTPAMEDLDHFRTQLRMDIYNEANEYIKEFLPNGQISIRTEGSNLIMKGNPKSKDMDERHMYYSQRRNAMVYDVVKDSKAIHTYSDYTTIPYTIEDWRRFTKETTDAGIISAPLPSFSGMRDILINNHYGKDYTVSYNLEKPSKGMFIRVLQSAFPVWRAIYEEGGATGTIWSDYLCDAYVTETQKKEIKILKERFANMKK